MRLPWIYGEPTVRVPEVGEVEPAEAGQRHPSVANDEVILWTAAPGAEAGAKVERFAPPFRKHFDRVIEWARVSGTQLEQPGERRGEPRLRPPVHLLPER